MTAPPLPSRLGLGCSRMGSFNNAAPIARQIATIAAGLDLGVRLFDTADIYGQGDSERMIGRALKGRRDEAFIVTKFGKRFSAKMRLMRPLKPLLKPLLAGRGGAMVTARRGDNMAEDWTPARFAAALDRSLRRLGMDHVDAVLLHSPPAEVVRQPAVAAALAALVGAGKARRFGVSCDDRACLEAALAMPGLGLLQLPIDMIEAVAPEGLLAEARARGIAILAREVILLRGSLSPVEAVARAAARDDVDCVLAGASDPARLAELAKAVG